MNTPLLHAWAARWQALRHRLPAGRTLVIGLPYGWLWLFFLLPFLFVLQISFSEVEIASPPYRTLISQSEDVLNIALNLDNYRFIFDDPLYLDAYLGSVKVALVTTLFCLLLGYPMAYAIARAAPTQRNTLLMLVMLPFWTSFLVRVYAWMGLLDNEGLINTLLLALGVIDQPLHLLHTAFSVQLVMVYTYLPFMILPLYSNLVKLDGRLLEAAADLGCRPWRAFVTVTLPLSKNGIVAGAMLVFIPAQSFTAKNKYELTQKISLKKIPIIQSGFFLFNLVFLVYFQIFLSPFVTLKLCFLFSEFSLSILIHHLEIIFLFFLAFQIFLCPFQCLFYCRQFCLLLCQHFSLLFLFEQLLFLLFLLLFQLFSELFQLLFLLFQLHLKLFDVLFQPFAVL